MVGVVVRSNVCLNGGVRWTGIDEEPDGQQLLPGAVRRTFDTPGFAGMTFYEVRAKSLINKMDGGFFESTINPYRGCTHACTYCLTGDTMILLADGGTKSLEQLEVGETIVGTVREGRSRRYTLTTVRAKWPTVKTGYRVRLLDGTELIASSDHRFLTEAGWKHVTASVAGPDRRPFLAIGDRILAVDRGLASFDLSSLQQSRPIPVPLLEIEPLRREMPMWDITTGTGDFIANGVVSHNCFARNSHTYLDLDAGLDFDSKIVVKVNAVELLRRELSARSWRGQSVAMGTNVDVYQRAEGRYELMPGIIKALTDFRNPFSILTKGTLILRDLPLLVDAAAVTKVSLAMSVGFVDETMWRLVEAGTPSPSRRLAAAAQLAAAGFSVTAMMAPILPGLTDDDESIDATVGAWAAAGAARLHHGELFLRTGAREWYQGWLVKNRPDLVPLYERVYRGKSYASADYVRLVTARVRRAMRRHGLATYSGPSSEPEPAPPADVQPALF